MKRLTLRVETGEKSGQVFEVGDAGLRLGRSSASDIQLLDEELSRTHCVFETSGEDGIRITDLASANGTFVNGKKLGEASVELKAGDVVTAGATRLTVVGEERPPPSEPKAKKADRPLPPLKSMQSERGSLFGKLLWLVALVAAGWALWSHRAEVKALCERYLPKNLASLAAAPASVKSFSYERVVADTENVYRAAIVLHEDGTLDYQIDDVPTAGRHEQDAEKPAPEDLKALLALFDDAELAACAGDSGGTEAEPQQLDSRTLSVVEASRSWRIRVVNAPVPAALARFCEKLEKLTGIGSR